MAERSQKVLIVDDEPLNRELLRRTLQRGYGIEEAEDVPRAVDVLEGCGGQISIILCDQLMPGQNGTDLAAIVRERWPHIPFLLLTGYDGDDEVQEAFQTGLIREIVAKPWRGTELRERLKDYL